MTAINHHTVVHSVNASRAESGTYLLRLTNDSGSDEGEEHSVQSRARVIVSKLPGVPYRRDVLKCLDIACMSGYSYMSTSDIM